MSRVFSRVVSTIFFAVATLATASVFAAERPRLVVNIVVSSMQADDLQRYAEGFGAGGFRRLTDGGVIFTESRYNYMQTTTPVSLATLSTGAMPSTHGIVSQRWSDYVDSKMVDLTLDKSVSGLEQREGKDAHSPRNLIAPTLTDATYKADSCSRLITIATDPVSAVVMGGKKGYAFWIDEERCRWTTSSYYTPYLPTWVKEYNSENMPLLFGENSWQSLHTAEAYRNSRKSTITFKEPAGSKSARKSKSHGEFINNYGKISRTPTGNTAIFDFAKYAVTSLNLGIDEHTDILNICLDPARNVASRYGNESVEYEDMLYALDRDLAAFLGYVRTHLKNDEALLVVLTSDHGTSPAYNHDKTPKERFNVRQFEVIVNAFLSAKYGQGQWILGYIDHSIYINHNLVYEKRLSIAEVQNEVATFAMQFRGVSHALSSTAMRMSYFGSGYAQKMQNSFYPRRSGDVVINLMPEWIEARDEVVSMSGSMYGYDTHVPLIFWGAGIRPRRIDEPVCMTSVAPTVARLMGIAEPAASEGAVLNVKQE
ncbi:MAG: alkaline phosphatase family protein [Alistipes sp.]|nr:alkaline phosphatase family protein [Alistipes sp.]